MKKTMSAERLLDLLNERIEFHTGQKMEVVLFENPEQFLKATRLPVYNTHTQTVLTTNDGVKDVYWLPAWDIQFTLDCSDGKVGVTGARERVEAFLGDKAVTY